MIGNLDVAFDVLEARGNIGENRRQKIVAANTLNLRWDFLASLKAKQRQRAVGVPAPACGEDRRSQRRLLQNLLHTFRLQIVKNVAQRKAVLFGQRDVQAVVGRCGLQLEVEGAAEAFAQRQPPRFVDACAERRMDDELHATAFIEEALGDDGLLSGNFAQHGAAGDHVFDDLLRAGVIEAALLFQPGDGVLDLGTGFQSAQPRRGGAASR